MKHRPHRKPLKSSKSQLVELLERRQLLSSVTWISTTGGSWNTAADWSSGVVPQAASNVIINQPGGIQITLAGNASVTSLAITGDALSVSGGTLTLSANSSIGAAATLSLSNATLATSTAASLTNSGAISVGSGSGLNLGGAYNASSAGAVSFASAVVGGNLLGNTGFESPSAGSSTTTSPYTWDSWGNSYVSTAFDHSGAQSLLQYGSNSGVFQSFAVTAGAAYTASVYAMNATAAPLAGPQGGFVNISFQNASGGSLSSGAEFVTAVNANSSTGSWINSTTVVTAPTGATAVTLDLQVGGYTGFSGTAGGSVYWDDVSLGRASLNAASGTAASVSNSGAITISPGAAFTDSGVYSETSTGALTLQPGTAGSGVGSNLVTNGSFASPAAGTSINTGPDVWGQWGNSYVSTQYTDADSQSLLQYGSNSGVSESFAVTAGVSYTVSVSALTPTGSSLTGPEGGFANITFSNSGGGTINSPSAFITAVSSTSTPGVWINSGTTLVAPAGAVSINLDLQAGGYTGNSGTAGGDVYWDNIQLGPTAITSASISAASVSNSGTITLGDGDTFTDSGSFAQTNTGILISQLGGTAAGNYYGSLTAGTSASLAGTLEATLVNGYSPSINDGFTILSYTSETGAFTSYQLPSGSAYVFQPGVNPTYVGISAVLANLTTTIAAAATTTTASTSFVGVNLAEWENNLLTTQTQQLVDSAGFKILRFPGGSASDDYHFNDQYNYGYGTINIPQFAQFVSQAGATGLVTVDYGSGSPQEAEAELAYLEGSTTDTTVIGTGIEWSDSAGAWQNVNWQTVSYWASLRAAKPLGTDDGLNFMRINQSAPYTNIKYWEIGNEEYYPWEDDNHGTSGPGGVSTGAQHDPATYAAFTAAFSKFVAADASLPQVVTGIGSASPNGALDNNLMQTVLTDLYSDGVVPGFLSDHVYMQNAGSESDPFLLNDTVSDSASLFDWSTRYADYESILKQVVGTANAAKVKIMATEFNSANGELGKQSTSLVDGLFVADSIGSLLNSGYSAGLVWDLSNGYDTDGNNSSTLYGWREGGDFGIIGAGQDTPPSTGPYVAYPAYFAEQLASEIMQNGGLDVSTSSSYSELQTYTVLEPNGHLDLMVINKNPDSTLTGQFNISSFSPSGQAKLWQYGEAQDYAQSQSSTGAAALANSSMTLPLNGNSFSYAFPAYSMSVIDLTPMPIVATAAGSVLTITLNNVAPISVGTSGTNVAVSEGGEQLTFPGITSVIVNGSNVIDSLTFTGPQTTPFTFQNSTGTTLNISSGTLTLAAGTGAAINVQNLLAINISAFAGLSLLPAAAHGTRTLLDIQTLTLAGSAGHWTAKVDLNSNDMIVTNGSLATISNQLQQGYNSGLWQGSGGIISSAAASNPSHLSTLGDILNSIDGTPTGAALYGVGTTLGLFDGTSPSSTSILVKYTYYGDANLSGAVDGTDYTRIDSGFLSGQTGWYFGDFNFDGVVNGSDYALIDNAFNTQGASLAAQLAILPTTKQTENSAFFSTATLSNFQWSSMSADLTAADLALQDMKSKKAKLFHIAESLDDQQSADPLA